MLRSYFDPFPGSFISFESIIGRAQKRKNFRFTMLFAISRRISIVQRMTSRTAEAPAWCSKRNRSFAPSDQRKKKDSNDCVRGGWQTVHERVRRNYFAARATLFDRGPLRRVDERVVKALKAEKDFYRFICALRRGIAAMVVVDAIARRIPGVLGKTESLEELRVSSPEVYTRPESFMFGKKNIRFPSAPLGAS